jgi:hypothetical protein
VPGVSDATCYCYLALLPTRGESLAPTASALSYLAANNESHPKEEHRHVDGSLLEGRRLDLVAHLSAEQRLNAALVFGFYKVIFWLS